MSTSLSLGPQPLLSFSPIHRLRFRTSQFQTPLFHRTHFSGPSISRTLPVAKFGPLGSGHLPDPESSEVFIRELFSKAEGLFYTIADAAVSNSEAVSSKTQQSNDWLSGISSSMEIVLKFLKDGLTEVHVPYAYGFAIILLTVIVKAATFPLTKKQVESAMAMKSLQPQIKAIQERYAGDKERIQLEIARIYKLAGINPLAGCLPTLATIPIWIGLYRALSNVANEGLLTEGFFWIPSLAGPTTIAARQNGSGISWLFPFVDGQPPLGWSDTLSYLVLPVLLVVSQYISVQIMQTSQSNDPNIKTSQAITRFLPLMIGYFALSVPSGLSLYWLTNNLLSTAQQVWLQKLGGAKNPIGAINEQIIMGEKPQNSTQTREVSSSTGLPPGERFKRLKEEEERLMISTQTEEASNSTALQPGERFKRLKEEEEKRRRQREEEKRRAEEVAANGVSMKEKDEKIAEIDQVNNSHPVEMIEKENGNDMKADNSHISSSNRSVMNGDSAVTASRKYESTSVPVDDNIGQSDAAAADEWDNRVTKGSSGKEVAEVTSGSTSMEDRFQGDEKTGPN